MGFYIFLAIFIAISSYFLKFFVRGEKCKQLQAMWGGIVLIVVAACRSTVVGVDTVQYVKAYKYVADISWSRVIDGTGIGAFEIGYRILMKIFTLVGTSEHFFIFWTSFLAIAPVVVFVYRYSKSPILSYVIYILSNQYFLHFGVIRQSVAFGFSLIAIMIMMEKGEKWVLHSILLIIVATSIHTGAIVTIALLMIVQVKKIDGRYYLVGILAVMVIMLFGREILTQLLVWKSQYSGYARIDIGAGRIVIVSAIMLFIIVHKKQLYKQDRVAIWWEKMISIVFLMKIFSYFFVIMSRAAALFETGYIVAIPNAVTSINKRNKIIWIMCIVGFFLIFYYIGYDVRNNYIFWV